MRVLGIDPGLKKTGWGIVDQQGPEFVHVDCGLLVTKNSDSIENRLLFLYRGVSQIILEYSPSLVAMEEVFLNKNFKSVLRLGYARAVVMISAAEAGLPVVGYPPATVKQCVVGTGRAEKFQVQKMITHILSLPEPPFEDACDALGVAICHLMRNNFDDRISKG